MLSRKKNYNWTDKKLKNLTLLEIAGEQTTHYFPRDADVAV